MTLPPSFGQSANPYAYKLLERISDWRELELFNDEGYKNYSSYPTPQPWRSFYPAGSLLEELSKAISRVGVRKIEYSGLADAEILRLLCSTSDMRSRVWDWFGYWHQAQRWNAESDEPESANENPLSWMRNLIFCFEGGFPGGAELLIADYFPFAEEGKVPNRSDLIQEFQNKFRVTAKCLVLCGLVADLAGGPKYDWQIFDGFSVGILKDKFLPEWERWIVDHPEYEHAYEF